MGKLTTREYWNGVWASPVPGARGVSLLRRAKLWLRDAIGRERISYFTRSYSDYQVLEGIYCHHMVSGSHLLEIGSAPGSYLVDLHLRFGIVPFGVEYTPTEAYINRQIF